MQKFPADLNFIWLGSRTLNATNNIIQTGRINEYSIWIRKFNIEKKILRQWVYGNSCIRTVSLYLDMFLGRGRNGQKCLIIILVTYDLQKSTVPQIKAKDILVGPYFISFVARINFF